MVSHAFGATETRNFDIKLIEEVKNVPALWDSRVEEYKLTVRKPAMWVQIAGKLGSSAGIIIAKHSMRDCILTDDDVLFTSRRTPFDP